jgi:Fungal protein kinase
VIQDIPHNSSSLHHDQENPRRFQTKSLISSSGADPLQGRGTWVFEAIEIDKNDHEMGSDVVLKDSWIDKDCTREGTILDQLYNEAKGNDKTLVQKHFPTTICYGDVCLDVGVVDNTDESIMHGLKVTDSKFSLSGVGRSINLSNVGPENLHMLNFPEYHSPAEYTHKVHSHVIFKERGMTIYHICLFPDVLKTAIDTVDGLSLSDHVYLEF